MRRIHAIVVGLAALPALVACGGGSGSGTSVESFCSQSAADESIFLAAGPDATDSAQAMAAFADLTKKAPSEIKADMSTILTFLQSSSSDAPDASTAASVTAASHRVVQFFKDKCHVDLAASGSSSFSGVASSISN